MSAPSFERDAGQSDPILERLLDLHPKKIDLSLGRIERLLKDLGSPQDRLPPVIHVAGTNGKGSSIAFMRAILEAAGKTVHVYTSPHLVRFHERIRLGDKAGGRLVEDSELAEALALCEKVNDGAPITFFEVTTAAAFVLFNRHPADYLLLEVGLGGRVDATNVIARPAATLITPVSMDHPEFLGNSVAEIAGEKAGILKPGVPAVLGFQQPEALAVLEAQAAKVGAPLQIAGQDFHVREEHGRLIYEDEAGLIDLPLPKLAGRHQHQNAAGAIATLRLVEPALSPHALEIGLATAEWPARLQRLSKGNLVALAPAGSEVWLDGAHNEDGARVLSQAMADREEKAPRPLVIVTGTLATKDTAAFLRAFKGLAQEVLAVPVHGEHAARTPADIAALANAAGLPAVACESIESALRFLTARKWAVPPRVLIAGSLYLAGEVLRLNGTPPR
ncbi:MAG: folylpolyglutamate synthase/dihydrofolate synthase family protein [Methylovirgula sp.]|uniref:bifunctional folylpolyglutamate synthase/dihydrofolate synthase n=1 Tax=Methylovirgula sp. TaxID=1978224 RepID=UPI0030764EE6